MDESAAKILLSLLLALKEVDLSPDEQSTLKSIGRRLDLRPDMWESIEKDLMAAIQANPAFHQKYQQANSRLEAMDAKELLALLPSEAELEQAIPDTEPVTFGPQPTGSPGGSDIGNTVRVMTVRVLETGKADETAKKLNGLQ